MAAESQVYKPTQEFRPCFAREKERSEERGREYFQGEREVFEKAWG